MSSIGRYIERVSQEDAAKTDVDLKANDPLLQNFDVSESEAVEEVDASDLVDVCEKGQGETDRFEITEIKHIKTALEEFGRIMENANERGGLHPNEAAMLNVGLEHFGKRLGVKFDKPLPSLEDFDKGMTRQGALTVSQELYIVIDQALIDKIIALIKKMIAKAKEFIGKLDLQTAKVDQIVARAKERYRRFRTGEVTFESSFGTLITSRDITPMGLNAVLMGGKQVSTVLGKFNDAVSSTNAAVLKLLSSDGGHNDIEVFNTAMETIWAGVHHPFTQSLTGTKHAVLSSVLDVTYTVVENNHPIDRYELQFNSGTREASASVTLKKADYWSMVDKVEKMNILVRQNGKTLSEIVGRTGKFGDLAKRAKTTEAADAIFAAVNALESITTVDLWNLVGKYGYIRNQIGYFLLLASDHFDKGGDSQNTANNTVSQQ